MKIDKAREIVSEHGGVEVGDKFELSGEMSDGWVYEVTELDCSGEGVRDIHYDIHVPGEGNVGEDFYDIAAWASMLSAGSMEKLDEGGDGDDGSAEPAATDEADDVELATDGGQTADVDPLDLDYDIVNRTKDSTNSRVNKLARVDGTDVWVAYRSWQTGDGPQASIKGIGTWTIEAYGLDVDAIADAIRDEASRLPDNAAALAATLDDRADEIATKVAEEWQTGVAEVVGDAIYEGYAGVDGRHVWVGHQEEAFSAEVDWTLSQLGIDDPDGFAADICRQALSDAVREHRDSWLRPHAEYLGTVEFEADEHALRALELQQRGGLPQKTAQVVARKEAGMTGREIATELDVNPSTVSRHLSRAHGRIDEAHWLVENVEL